MTNSPRIKISIAESAVVVGIIAALIAILIPSVEAASEASGGTPLPWLPQFFRDHPLVMALIATLVSVVLTVGLLAAFRSLSPHLARRIVWTKPDSPPEISPETQARITTVLSVLVFGAIVLCCSGIVVYSRPENIAQLQLSPSLTARIFAEGAVYYEPPGYLSIEVLDGDKIIIPRYAFVGIGPERVPKTPFSLVASDDHRVAVLIQGNDIQFMMDLETREYWPPCNWNVVELAPDLADRLLASFASHPELTCSRLDMFKKQAARRRSRDAAQH